jgi:hypothetical protein
MVSFVLWLGTVGLAMARERRNALPLPNGGAGCGPFERMRGLHEVRDFIEII